MISSFYLFLPSPLFSFIPVFLPQSKVYSLRNLLHLTTKMRFAAIVTAFSAVAATGVMSAAVAQPKVGVATDGNVTATVEMVKNDDGTEVARITYATVDVDHPDKLAPPVTRFCWDIGRECSTFEDL